MITATILLVGGYFWAMLSVLRFSPPPREPSAYDDLLRDVPEGVAYVRRFRYGGPAISWNDPVDGTLCHKFANPKMQARHLEKQAARKNQPE